MRLYNTPIEIGIRSLIILSSNSGKALDIEKLMFLDYLCLHSSDIGGPESLHAAIPNRGVQVYSKKELIRKGLAIMLSKELIDFTPNNQGFMYSINSAGNKFLTFFQTNYFKNLEERAKWVSEKYGNYSNSDFQNFFNEKISSWGNEFISLENLSGL